MIRRIKKMRTAVQWVGIIGIVLGAFCAYGNPYYMTNPSDIDVTYAHNAAEEASRNAWDLRVSRDRVSITDNPRLYMDMYVREQQYENEAIRHRQNAQQMEEMIERGRGNASMPLFISPARPVQKKGIKSRKGSVQRNVSNSRNATDQVRRNELQRMALRMRWEANARARQEHNAKVRAAFNKRWSVEASSARKKARAKPKKSQKELVAEAIAAELALRQADSSDAR